MTLQTAPRSTLARIVNELEESAIALILGLMTLITFVNVVLRYGFHSGLIWGLEATGYLFAWLVLFGVSYGIKVTSHLGVDAITGMLPAKGQRIVGLISAALCLIYAFLLMKGAWDYWANFANLPQTTGRWFPTGFEDMKRTSYRAWYAAVDIPMPEFLRFLEPLMNEGEAYEKLPRFIPYFILPFGMALFLFRLVEATVHIWFGRQDSLIVSHEAEDAVEEAAARVAAGEEA